MINKGGEIGHMKKINDTHNELTVTRNQLAKVNDRLSKLDEIKGNNQEQITSLTEKLNKLQSVAEKHDIDINKVAKEVERKHDYEDFAEIKKEMLHKKGILENAIRVQKKKYQQIFSIEKKKYEQMLIEKEEMTKMLEEKEKEAQEKKLLIKDLKVKYDKYKTEAGFNNYVKDSDTSEKKDGDENRNGKEDKNVKERKSKDDKRDRDDRSHDGKIFTK